MGSTFGGINMISRSLTAHQIAQNTVGHNISNADTVGYSRQIVNMLAMTPAGEEYGRYGSNKVGTGVIVGSIVRARDFFTDKQYWKESANLGYLQSANYIYGKVELTFQEPSETGIQSVLNSFWTSWQNLGTNASSYEYRAAVAQKGVAVANAINVAAGQLIDQVEVINDSLTSNVETVNRLTESIEKLNQQIAYIEAGGHNHANDLRDSRDLLVDELSKYFTLSVTEDAKGKYTITAATENAGDITLVDADGSYQLGIKDTETDPDFGYQLVYVTHSSGAVLTFTNGEMQALVDLRDTATAGIHDSLSKLSAISQYLLQEFNEVHKTGFGMDDESGRNFFGESGIDYMNETMTLGEWIQALKVNSEITKSDGSGYAYIAAKTATNVAAVSSVVSNLGEGYPSITTDGAYSGGTVPTDVLLRVGDVDAATGEVTSLQYSLDDGDTWVSATPSVGNTFTFNEFDVDVTVDTSTMTNAAVNNKYSFTLGLGNYYDGQITTGRADGSTNAGSGNLVVTTSGGYTGESTSSDILLKIDSLDSDGNIVGLKYSENGGTTWYEVVGNSSDPLSFIVKGVEVKLDISDLHNSQVGDRYEFSIAEGSSAGSVSDAPSNEGDGVLTVDTATGTYTGGAVATNVLLEVTSTGLVYSIDGGKKWDTVPSGGAGPFEVAGIEITLDITGMSGAEVGDRYSLSVTAGNNALGDNALLLGNSLKDDASSTLGNMSLDSFYAALIGALGVKSQDSQRLETNQQAVIDQLYNMRQDVSGVSTEEELVDMIRFQKGYNSAARVLTAMDEMLDKLINGTGVVGR